MSNLTNKNIGKYIPSTLTEVSLDDTGAIVSVGDDFDNDISSGNLVIQYKHENLLICPTKDVLLLTLGIAENISTKICRPLIFNNPSNISDSLLKITFNNIWKFIGNSTLGNAGVVNIQHGFFGICSKILNFKQGSTSTFFYINGLILTDEEKQIKEAGGILWKDKVIITNDQVNNLASTVPSTGYENLACYKIDFNFLIEGLNVYHGTDIEFFDLKESYLDLTYAGYNYKLNKSLGYDSQYFEWKVPTRLVIKNELIQCYPSEGYVYNSSFDIVDYGVGYTYTYNSEVSSYHVILKIWCPDTTYLSQQIVSLGAFYNSVEITDLKNCVRQFKISIANPASNGSDIGYWKMVMHLNYSDNSNIQYSRDYNLVFHIV